MKAVEPFREKIGDQGFLRNPAPDGSRPGTYYVNLYDLKAKSKSEIEACSITRAARPSPPALDPGRTRRHPRLPPLRHYPAYLEGWGLYAEQLGKDMGFYTDPYSDLGRLSMEILRAGRLVVDPGIHAKRWSREQAIDWYLANTPVTDGDVRNQVERYIVIPGQATAYTVGKLKIEELRPRAERAARRALRHTRLPRRRAESARFRSTSSRRVLTRGSRARASARGRRRTGRMPPANKNALVTG